MEHLYQDALAPNLYYDRNFNIQAVKILPGEYYATARPMLIVTVLGSCVSACIRDRVSGIGGMNHFMLPALNDFGEPVNASARYGTYAMEILINQLLKMGVKRQNLEAKVFGGGNVIKGFTVANVGERNAAFVREYLKAEEIPIVAEDLLDIYPRKVYFFPAQGRVLIKKLMSLHNDTILRREQEYNTRLGATAERGGDVDLF
ncbi:chemoreceptor glutamine deamidase CheD [Methylococcus sp. EFPC2]|uniref:chemoreceptor glutamine deamidase CheD n=1 Tax=Methylococcus sp. EFPC2 TaxID=2812648 RepID=UPI0019671FE3|nr:chemoreceptor glutamine deamidase CheD [Methylococcus sp. EFPC2]QSA98689.1 chemoreceptor glutamine deamidase CheD [Methylococcus sp. EFPC2]